ncbi:uncharacterized protein [Clytia hemisphaerica]|uniref:EGF-like domain-containing protein n=1 Tax=Clytia hemisphaerica TaxID=252671 RepID=A0A7M5WJ33_9CNID
MVNLRTLSNILIVLYIVGIFSPTNANSHTRLQKHRNTEAGRRDTVLKKGGTQAGHDRRFELRKNKLKQLMNATKDSEDLSDGVEDQDLQPDGNAEFNPMEGNNVAEPIGYDATGLNYRSIPTEDSEQRLIANNEIFNDENTFINNGNALPPLEDDTENENAQTPSESESTETVSEDPVSNALTGSEGQAANALIQSVDQGVNALQTPSVENGNVQQTEEENAGMEKTETGDENAGSKSIVSFGDVFNWLKGLFSKKLKKKKKKVRLQVLADDGEGGEEVEDDEKSKEEREKEENLKAKLLKVFQEEKLKEKLKIGNQKLFNDDAKKKLAAALDEKAKSDKERAEKEKQKLVAKLQNTNQQDDKQQQAPKLPDKPLQDDSVDKDDAENIQALQIQQNLLAEKGKLQEQENLRKLHAMAIAASKARQKLINQLMQNATRLSEKSRQNIELWLKNITGMDIGATTNLNSKLTDMDLMTLNRDYFIHHPPNHVIYFNQHQPMTNPTTYHVTKYSGGHLVHHYEHFYNQNPSHVSVNHYVSRTKPCLNGGLIVPLGNGEVGCVCKNGFYGPYCEDFDYCSLKPCKNRGKCYPIDVAPRIQCTCLKQFYGKLCEKVNPCFEHVCKNGGTCTHNGEGKTECVCKPGYNGDRCQYIDSCLPSPCKNGGVCHQTVVDRLLNSGNFTCECPIQFKGPLCQYPAICNRRPCHNGGICRETDDDEDFQCMCPRGFIGKTCEERPCSPNPCMNGATCSEEGSNATCICTKWTKGQTCEIVSPCALKPCGPNGYCIDSESGFKVRLKPMQYFCICKPPFMGPGCHDNICNHCSLNAHCNKEKQCVCDEGYVGDGMWCAENATDPCLPNPCKNDGGCVVIGDGKFECRCKPPFKGPLCEAMDACNPDPCKNGRCEAFKDGTFKCHCLKGYFGDTCNVSDPCIPNPCQHGGVCTKEGDEAKCKCKGRWDGPVCKDCGCPKSTNPQTKPDSYCMEDGNCQCYDLGVKKFNFVTRVQACVSFDTEVKSLKTLCEPNPCKNGGTCLLFDDGGSFECKCTKYSYGTRCENMFMCQPKNPCKNGGKCEEKGDGKFECKCPPNTTPPVCDAVPFSTTLAPNTHCTPNPCQNEGICKTLYNGYDCICTPRFTGSNCQVDRCQDCDTEHAHCVLGHCRCKPGYIGNGYECMKDDTPLPPCGRCPMHAYCLPTTGHCSCRTGYVFEEDQCIARKELIAIPPPAEHVNLTSPVIHQANNNKTLANNSTLLPTQSTPVQNDTNSISRDRLQPTNDVVLQVTKTIETLKHTLKEKTLEKSIEEPKHKGFLPFPMPDPLPVHISSVKDTDDLMAGPPAVEDNDASGSNVIDDSIPVDDQW